MSSKVSKKGRNPGLVDSWLENLELYRKNVAYDETCLFRAVSEQLFECQVFHERVRKECIEYGRSNFDEFKNLIDNKDEWERHLDMLEKHMVVCGNVEINIISKKYNRDILIFHANQQKIYDVTKHGLPSKPIMLCLMDDDHYDAVYSKEHIAEAGFCQSIVYKMLYEDVYKISSVDKIVSAMLYEKTNIINLDLGEKDLSCIKEDSKTGKTEDVSSTMIAPFPFKVAKALDPTIYRNIEYDSWGEVRRELRLGDWYYGDDKLKLGTRCVLKDDITGDMHDCYIQELVKSQEQCVVYLTKLAEKRIVNYSDLAPETDPKPWPLPYRFSKNLVIHNTAHLPPIEKIKNVRKRNKENKRQSKSLTEVNIVGNESIDNVKAYVGAPLHMHNNNNNESPKTELSSEVTHLNVSHPPEDVAPVTPDINNYPQRYQWEQVNWPTPFHYMPPPEGSYYQPQTPEPFVWPQGGATPYFDYKPMVASAPTTPNIIPYHDTSFPFFYNYHVDHYPLTPTTPTSGVMPQNPHNTPDKGLETPPTPQGQQSLVDIQAPVSSQGGRQNVAYVSQPPQSMEMYPQVVPLPPGTPLIYTTIPPDLEMVLPNNSVGVYTPTTPNDMQYVPSPGFLYSPGQNAPPLSWFQHPYNSQGFIFPPPQQGTKQ